VIDESGFVSYRGSRILHVFKRFVSWIRFVDWFSKDSTCFYKSYKSLQILSTIARNKSLKIKIRESESLRILKIRIRESRFVTPNPKYSYRGFVSWICFWKIRFVDSFRANQNLKLLDSFRFVRIRIRIPHPYKLDITFEVTGIEKLSNTLFFANRETFLMNVSYESF
jgi:hypothetical protein